VASTTASDQVLPGNLVMKESRHGLEAIKENCKHDFCCPGDGIWVLYYTTEEVSFSTANQIKSNFICHIHMVSRC
jgi:hypothetical protein